MKKFQNVTNRSQVGTNFIFQGFPYERNEMLLNLIPFN